MSRVACIGAGNVGRAWAIRFAVAGHEVRLFDLSAEVLDQSMSAIDQSLQDLQRADMIERTAEVRARIVPATALGHALEDVIYVQENVTENLALKQQVFAELDQHAPADAVLASSTSEIPGSKMFPELKGRHRCLVAHPLNPPFLIPLVELCPSPWTSTDTVDIAKSFLSGCGQKPILVNREICGFIANRLQLAVLGEALHLVGEGYCSAEDIDIAMTEGLARRWAVIGPFETGHLNASQGYRAYLDVFAETHRRIIADLRVDYPWNDELINRVHQELAVHTPVEDVPARQAWRDRQLMALNQHLKAAAQGSEHSPGHSPEQGDPIKP